MYLFNISYLICKKFTSIFFLQQDTLRAIKQRTEELAEDDYVTVSPVEPAAPTLVITIGDDDEAIIDLTGDDDDKDIPEPAWAEFAKKAVEKERQACSKSNTVFCSETSCTSQTTESAIEIEDDDVNLTQEDNFIEPISQLDYLSKMKPVKQPVSSEAKELLAEIQNMKIVDLSENEQIDDVIDEDSRKEVENPGKSDNVVSQESNCSTGSSDISSPSYESLSSVKNRGSKVADKSSSGEILVPKISDIQGSVTDWPLDVSNEESRSKQSSELSVNNDEDILSDNSISCEDSNDKNRGISSKYSDMSEEALLRDEIEIPETMEIMPLTENLNEIINGTVNEQPDKRDIVSKIIDEFSDVVEVENMSETFSKPDIEMASFLKNLKVKGVQDINFGVSVTSLNDNQVQVNTFLPLAEREINVDVQDTVVPDKEINQNIESEKEGQKAFGFLPNRELYNFELYKQQVHNIINEPFEIIKKRTSILDDDSTESESQEINNEEEEQNLLVVRKTSKVKQYGRCSKSSENTSKESLEAGVKHRRRSTDKENKTSASTSKTEKMPMKSDNIKNEEQDKNNQKTEPLKSLLKVSSKNSHYKTKHVHFENAPSKIYKPEMISTGEIKIGKMAENKNNKHVDIRIKPSKSDHAQENKSAIQKNRCISRVYKNKATIEHHSDEVSDSEDVKDSDSDDNVKRKTHEHHKKRRNSYEESQQIFEEKTDGRRKRKISFLKDAHTKHLDDSKHKKDRRSISEDEDIDESKTNDQSRKLGRKRKKSSPEETRKDDKHTAQSKANKKPDFDELHRQISNYVKKNQDDPKKNKTIHPSEIPEAPPKVDLSNPLIPTDKRPIDVLHKKDLEETEKQLSNQKKNKTKHRTKTPIEDAPKVDLPNSLNVKITKVMGNYESSELEPMMEDQKNKKTTSNVNKLSLCRDFSIKLIKDPLISSVCATESTVHEENEDEDEIIQLNNNLTQDCTAAMNDDNSFIPEGLNEEFELGSVYNSSYSELSGVTEQGEGQYVDGEIVNSGNCDNLGNIGDKTLPDSKGCKYVNQDYMTIAQPPVPTIPNSIFEKFVEQRTKVTEISLNVPVTEAPVDVLKENDAQMLNTGKSFIVFKIIKNSMYKCIDKNL